MAEALTDAGHDAVHVQSAIALDAADEDVFERARLEQRVIVTADTDFGDLLAHRTVTEPSVVLFRRRTGRRPGEQADLLLEHLDAFGPDLADGAIVGLSAKRLWPEVSGASPRFLPWPIGVACMLVARLGSRGVRPVRLPVEIPPDVVSRTGCGIERCDQTCSNTGVQEGSVLREGWLVELDELQVGVFRLHGEGRYREALALVDKAEPEAPADAVAKLAFWRACLLALDGHAESALAVLERAAEAGCWWNPAELADDDLAAIADDPRFGELQRLSRQRLEAARRTPAEPQILGATNRSAPTVVGLHRASSSPARAASLWAPLADSGWRVVLPAAPHPVNSGDRVWLDLDRGELDLSGAADVVEPHVPAEAAPVVLGGFAQGGAIALHLALSGRVAADAVVLVAATHRYREILDGAGTPIPERLDAALIVAGDRERHVDAAAETAEWLQQRGVRVQLDVREGIGHTVPPSVPHQLPELLSDLVGVAHPERKQ